MTKTYDIVGKKKIYFTISLAIFAVAIIVSFFGVKFDIAFKGGTIIEYSFTGDVDAQKVDKIATDILKTDITVKKSENISDGATSFQLSFNKKDGLSAEEQTALTDKLTETFPDNNFDRLNSNDVNASVGKDFFNKCLVAVAFSFVVLVVYIGLRFRKISGWSAGIMAIIALLHDVFVVYAVFVIFRMPIDANFMAVVLTILGYSINDTIVIYDRIRENEKLMPKGTTYESLVNTSVSQCLTRSFNTTISTIIALVVVTVVALITGVNSILSFSFPLIIGLVSGTYSTICIATPLWVMWQNHKKKNHTDSYSKVNR